MKILVPHVVEPSHVVSSTGGAELTTWSSLVGYGKGNSVVTDPSGDPQYWTAQFGTIRPMWTCFFTPAQENRDKNPLLSPQTSTDNCYPEETQGQYWWLETTGGIVDYMRMFSPQLGLPTCDATPPLRVEVNPPDISDSLAFFSVKASQIDVEVRDSGSAVIYSAVKDLAHVNPVFDGTYAYNDRTVFLDLPLLDPAVDTYVIDVTFQPIPGETEVCCGLMAIGRTYTIGCTQLNSAVGIQDYSRKDFDVFGNAIIIERAYADTAEYLITLDTGKIHEIKNFLASRRAIPTVFIGHPDIYETIVYGYYRDLSFPIQAYSQSDAFLEVRGLV